MDSQKRQCWICYSEEIGGGGGYPLVSNNNSTDSILGDAWIRPCKCCGSTAWVHHACLISWINRMDEGTGQTSLIPPSVKCPQCQTQYVIRDKLVLPYWMLAIIQRVEGWKKKILVYLTATGAAASLYIVSFAYGSAAILATSGQEELAKVLYLLRNVTSLSGSGAKTLGESLMVMKTITAIPMVPLFVLSMRFKSLAWLHPMIPALVYTGPESLKFIRPLPASTMASLLPFASLLYRDFGQGFLIPWLRKRIVSDLKEEDYYLDYKITTNRSLTSLPDISEREDNNADEEEEEEEEEAADASFQRSVIDITSTLFLPFVSAGVGWLVARRCSPFTRTIVGGSLVLLTNEIIKSLIWYQKIMSSRKRRVLDYHQ